MHENQQTARQEKTGSAHHKHLVFMETYYAKPWLQKAATDQMLFTQIYYLKKKYGPAAEHLTSAIEVATVATPLCLAMGKTQSLPPASKIVAKNCAGLIRVHLDTRIG